MISPFHKELSAFMLQISLHPLQTRLRFFLCKLDQRLYLPHEPIIRSIKRLRSFFSTEVSPEGDWLLTRNHSKYRTNFFKSSATRMYPDGQDSESILNYDTSSRSTWVSVIYSILLRAGPLLRRCLVSTYRRPHASHFDFSR